MALKLKTYEDQAKFSVLAAVVGGVCVFAAMLMIVQRLDWTSLTVTLHARGLRFFVLLGMIAIALAAGTTGFFVGLNSAGQRRNKLSNLSWKGFFLNAAVITLALSVFIFFWLTKNTIAPT